MYYRRANAAVIVYDIANQKSFQEAKSWMEGNHSVPVVTSYCNIVYHYKV